MHDKSHNISCPMNSSGSTLREVFHVRNTIAVFSLAEFRLTAAPDRIAPSLWASWCSPMSAGQAGQVPSLIISVRQWGTGNFLNSWSAEISGMNRTWFVRKSTNIHHEERTVISIRFYLIPVDFCAWPEWTMDSGTAAAIGHSARLQHTGGFPAISGDSRYHVQLKSIEK